MKIIVGDYLFSLSQVEKVLVREDKGLYQINLCINKNETIKISSNNKIVIDTIFDSLFEFNSFDITSICEWDLDEGTQVSFFVWLLNNPLYPDSHKAIEISPEDCCGKFIKEKFYLADGGEAAYMYTYNVDK